MYVWALVKFNMRLTALDIDIFCPIISDLRYWYLQYINSYFPYNKDHVYF